MGLNTLETAYVNGQVIDASHINELTLALLGQLVGRDANGVPTPGQSLGTLAIPWGNIYATGLILNGEAIDTSLITALANRIVSGQTRSLSGQPDFLRADGAALACEILGATTDLVLSINNSAVSVTSDLSKTGLSAAPNTNNTAQINDTTMSNDEYAGEYGAAIEEIIIDNVGSEVSALVGQIVAFQTPTGEIFKGYLESATKIINVFRGYYFDDTGTPIERGNLSNNDTITLMKIGYIFVEDNGTTVDVTYTTPSISFTAPSGPSTGDYWFDISNQVWKRYSGIAWEIIDRILIGEIVSDDTNTIASRSYDFSNQFRELNTAEITIKSSEIIETVNREVRVNVYGTELIIDLSKLSWNITTDLETGLTEAASTDYYLYVDSDGQTIISTRKPYYRPDLKGWYHPYHTWRCVSVCFNDSSSDLVAAAHVPYNSEVTEQKVVIKNQSTSPQASASGTVTTCGINTREKDTEIIHISSNQIYVLPGQNDYFIRQYVFAADDAQILFYDVTGSTYREDGEAAFIGSGANAGNFLALKGNLRIDKTRIYEVRAYTQTSNPNGLGRLSHSAAGNPATTNTFLNGEINRSK